MKRCFFAKLGLIGLMILSACSNSSSGNHDAQPNDPETQASISEIRGIYEALDKAAFESARDLKRVVNDYKGQATNAASVALIQKTFSDHFPSIINSLPAVDDQLANNTVKPDDTVDSQTGDLLNWREGKDVFDAKSAPATRSQPPILAIQLVKALPFLKKGSTQQIRLTLSPELRALKHELLAASYAILGVSLDANVQNLSAFRESYVKKLSDVVQLINHATDSANPNISKIIAKQSKNLPKYIAEIQNATEAHKESLSAKVVAENKAAGVQAEKTAHEELNRNYLDLLIDQKKAQKIHDEVSLLLTAYRADKDHKLNTMIREKDGYLEINVKNVPPEKLYEQRAKNAVANEEFKLTIKGLTRMLGASNLYLAQTTKNASDFKYALQQKFVRADNMKSGDNPTADFSTVNFSSYDWLFENADVQANSAVLAKGKEWFRWAERLLPFGASLEDLNSLPVWNERAEKALQSFRAEAEAEDQRKAKEVSSKNAFLALVDSHQKAKAANIAKNAETQTEAKRQADEAAIVAEANFHDYVESLIKDDKAEFVKVLKAVQELTLVKRQSEEAQSSYMELHKNEQVPKAFGTVFWKIDEAAKVVDSMQEHIKLELANKIADAKLRTNYFADELNDKQNVNAYTDFAVFLRSNGTQRRVDEVYRECLVDATTQVRKLGSIYLEDVLHDTGPEATFVSDFYSKLVHRTVYLATPTGQQKAQENSKSETSREPDSVDTKKHPPKKN